MMPSSVEFPPNARFCENHFSPSDVNTNKLRKRLKYTAQPKDVLTDEVIESGDGLELERVLYGLADCPQREEFFPLSPARGVRIFQKLSECVDAEPAMADDLQEAGQALFHRLQPEVKAAVSAVMDQCSDSVKRLLSVPWHQKSPSVSNPPDIPGATATPPRKPQADLPQTPIPSTSTPSSVPPCVSEQPQTPVNVPVPSTTTPSTVSPFRFKGRKRIRPVDPDASFRESEDSSESSSVSSEEGPSEQYFIVHTSELKKLMKHCPQCGNLFLSKKFTSEGAIFQLQAECHKCGNVSWSSSPTIAPTKVATINVDLASSFFLSAVNTAAVYRLANSMALSLPTQKTLSIHQQAYLYPAIAAKFLSQQAAFVDELKGRGEIHLSGDGRFSKPGHSAKYCTYSLMEEKTKKVLHSVTLQKTETTSSAAMEELGLRRCLLWFQNTFGKLPTTLCTDRHTGIQRLMRTDFPETRHVFDAWHLQKSLCKALSKVGFKMGKRELAPWTRHLSNHLLWSIANCDDDFEKLMQLWGNAPNHMSNIHSNCVHAALSEPDDPDREHAWLDREAPAFDTVRKVVENPLFCRDLRQATILRYSSELESFHSELNVYLPKKIGVPFSHFQQKARLAVIDHNFNAERKQIRTHVIWARQTKRWKLQAVREAKSNQWRRSFRDDVFERVATKEETTTSLARKHRQHYHPRRITNVPKPDLDTLKEQYELQQKRKREQPEVVLRRERSSPNTDVPELEIRGQGKQRREVQSPKPGPSSSASYVTRSGRTVKKQKHFE